MLYADCLTPLMLSDAHDFSRRRRCPDATAQTMLNDYSRADVREPPR